jgi:hypothetical protein
VRGDELPARERLGRGSPDRDLPPGGAERGVLPVRIVQSTFICIESRVLHRVSSVLTAHALLCLSINRQQLWRLCPGLPLVLRP